MSKKKETIRSLYYITHVDNVPSIIEKGIFSHSEMVTQEISFTPIYDAQIVSNRQQKATPSGETLWDYANLYFQARNPMMYRVMLEKTRPDIAVIGIDPAILDQNKNTYITDGNAASNATNFYSVDEGKKIIDSQWDCITSDYWRESDGSKRKIMAECLVPRKIPAEMIHSVFLSDRQVQQSFQRQIPSRISIVYEPSIFFQANIVRKIGNISLVQGDMFFSKMQTLTVSVNLQGIMGKGLASRAKYQFPDVYVAYQDMCRSRRLTASKPCLYKREISIDEELADQTGHPIRNPNAVKWFLLFATKRRWQENSRLDDIEAGLEWFRCNFKKAGIESIAFPALGCGLGGQPWSKVGQIMCRALHNIGINVAIYLPQEKKIDPEHLSSDYLLS